MKMVECGGARVAYRVDGDGPGLVLVHGTGGNAETNWGHLVPDLARHWRVVRPDYSGSGETRDDGGPLGVSRLAAEVVAAAEAADAAPFDLVGFSLGAAVAMTIADEYPHLVRRVVLLGAFIDGADPRQRMQFGLWRDLIASDRAAMARLVLLTGFSPAFLSRLGHDGIAEAISGIVSSNDWEGMARQVELDLTIDVRAAARRIEAPVLVIGCTHDHMVPPDEARAVAAQIPGARYAEMPTGHLAAIEQPDAFTALLRDFLLDGGSD
ncbi:alpha/beta fold hydrolase [Segnochrobactrum spirostomi]|uniref:Alpha/beta fold hydrolase n=1 Tax=Segnochrobactrum spirostomi TaxID=2608987 RepID=A0A6A7Y789_9HYPH|nr:alpha/beta fold hydrolase [Segnochrobactrum spirostomi]MQT14565.1 alpha/beta fold hydrolase [Segnochrobactrum spirostomi]